MKKVACATVLILFMPLAFLIGFILHMISALAPAVHDGLNVAHSFLESAGNEIAAIKFLGRNKDDPEQDKPDIS